MRKLAMPKKIHEVIKQHEYLFKKLIMQDSFTEKDLIPFMIDKRQEYIPYLVRMLEQRKVIQRLPKKAFGGGIQYSLTSYTKIQCKVLGINSEEASHG